MSLPEQLPSTEQKISAFDQAKIMSGWFPDYVIGIAERPDALLPALTYERLSRHFGDYADVGLDILRDEIVGISSEQQFDIAVYICGFPEENVRHQLRGSFKDVITVLDSLYPPLVPEPVEVNLEPLRHLLPLIDASDARWKELAACRGTADPEAFFPGPGQSAAKALGKCAVCNVEEICLKFAIEKNEAYGVWGGMDAAQRRKFRKKIEDLDAIDGFLKGYIVPERHSYDESSESLAR